MKKLQKLSRKYIGLLVLTLVGCALSACSEAVSPSSNPTTPSPNQSVTSQPEPSATETPTPSFTPNSQLSDQENSFAQQVMAANDYNQATAEAVLIPAKSVCNLLDVKHPDSEANKKFLHDLFNASDKKGAQQEWYNNILIATQTMCADKTPVVRANKPQGVSEVDGGGETPSPTPSKKEAKK